MSSVAEFVPQFSLVKVCTWVGCRHGCGRCTWRYFNQESMTRLYAGLLNGPALGLLDASTS